MQTREARDIGYPMKRVDEAVNQVFKLLADAKERGYIGEPVSQLEHALQTAKFAQDRSGTPALVIAALFHDIGHLCAPKGAATMDGFGIDEHHKMGARWLTELGFSSEIGALVEGHVEAKRYLVAKNPRYFEKLSDASRETLKRQGGPMSVEEMKEFEGHPLFKQCLVIRTFDDQAKMVDWQVPDLDSYRELVRNHLLENARSIGN